MSVSVVISTFNNPTGLRMCLLGMLSQTIPPDQIIIADDGSRQADYVFLHETPFSSLPIDTVWHPDRGWQKNYHSQSCCTTLSWRLPYFL